MQARKESLRAKHIEGRESLNELDYIFNDKREESKTENYLEEHQRMMER